MENEFKNETTYTENDKNYTESKISKNKVENYPLNDEYKKSYKNKKETLKISKMKIQYQTQLWKLKNSIYKTDQIIKINSNEKFEI